MKLKYQFLGGTFQRKRGAIKKDAHVLVFHGIMDNAGSFDHLIPLLPKQFYYVCVDLPGHGLSSHFPKHIPIYTLSYIMVYKLLTDYFDKNHYIIMGHSYGGQLGILYAQLYPQCVEKLILLDTINLIPVTSTNFKHYLVERFDNFLLFEKKMLNNGSQPTYTYDEAVDKLQLARFSPISTQAAIALSHRSLMGAENGRYRFRLDQRIKNSINPLRDFKYVIATLKADPVLCPILIILGKENKVQLRYMNPVLTHLKKFKNVKVKMVDGYHDVHSDSPELVAPYICLFLLHKKGKL
ncbi:hypothetical protein NQ315_012727 [Exocentrus adspersus]|uniref:AB hydrolase-1 domain-containing protein n=1 Tax=Exocentrus adspersus TaxID=1586481 RepID=A0AAV8VF91_9CUCU|nr:hypothetical protein NQ315_012727 [Exocentrus adspersus]